MNNFECSLHEFTHIQADVHPKSKNKSAVKALYLLAFTPNSKLFSSDYPYVPAWQYFWQLYL